MQPSTIHRYAAGPNFAPMIAPKIGPVPAMLRNCIIKTFHVGNLMKSTPSLWAAAGVAREKSGEKWRSTIRP